MYGMPTIAVVHYSRLVQVKSAGRRLLQNLTVTCYQLLQAVQEQDMQR